MTRKASTNNSKKRSSNSVKLGKSSVNRPSVNFVVPRGRSHPNVLQKHSTKLVSMGSVTLPNTKKSKAQAQTNLPPTLKLCYHSGKNIQTINSLTISLDTVTLRELWRRYLLGQTLMVGFDVAIMQLELRQDVLLVTQVPPGPVGLV